MRIQRKVRGILGKEEGGGGGEIKRNAKMGSGGELERKKWEYKEKRSEERRRGTDKEECRDGESGEFEGR